MPNSLRRLLVVAAGLAVAVAAVTAGGSSAKPPPTLLDKVSHIVVIYEENHSFDNLYGGWEGVNGRANADAAHTIQVAQNGVPYKCLLQNDVNLTSPPLAVTCTDPTFGISSAFPNGPFLIDSYIPPSATTCPPPGVFAANGVPNGSGLPGGCTRDIVHRFYQEQYQLDGGKQDRYVTGSDAVGLTMGVYDTKALPIYQYLHGPDAPAYAIADNFFQGAFGGSFLNHQVLIAAQPPVFTNADQSGGSNDLHSIVDSNGMPTSYPLYTATGPVKDGALTEKCSQPGIPPGTACGDWAVNTIQPFYQPYAPGTAVARRLPPQTGTTIGDELSQAGVSWAWYSGGWSNADGDIGAPGWTNGTGPTCGDPNTIAGAVFPNCPDKLFQFHHQPFNYYASFAPGTQARAEHLRDEAEFISQVEGSHRGCGIPAVSFVKPIGAENEHPGYASEHTGSDHLVSLLKAIEGSACAKQTMVIVTYDEFGGQWDHVSPPSATNPIGPFDQWGPGTRLPALVLAPGLFGRFVVDHTEHDTTSILTTIEHRFGLAPLTNRDRDGHDLSSVFFARPAGF
jgi:phospholipase C